MSPLPPGPRADGDHRSRAVVTDLGSASPAQVAAFIRGLDSRLVGIERAAESERTALIYTFALAGAERSFRAEVVGGTLDSIVPWYPEAADHERRLGAELGIIFTPPEGPAPG